MDTGRCADCGRMYKAEALQEGPRGGALICCECAVRAGQAAPQTRGFWRPFWRSLVTDWQEWRAARRARASDCLREKIRAATPAGDSGVKSFLAAARVVVVPMQILAGLCWCVTALGLVGSCFAFVRYYEQPWASYGASVGIMVPVLVASLFAGLVGVLFWCAALWFLRFSELLGRITVAIENRRD